MEIEPFGKIEYKVQDKCWFGNVKNISPNNKVELSISTENKDQDLQTKIELIRNLSSEYYSIISNLYDLIYNSYKGTEYEVERQEIENMYFLSGVDLKEDNKTYWLVLEPNFKVSSVYNHFMRFTMVDRSVVWTNLHKDTTA